MRFEKQLRPHWAREQTVNLTEQNTKVLRRQELRRDFTGESTLRPTAEFLFEAFEAARPSSRELLRTRTCWPVGFEADRSDLGGVLYQPFGHSLAIDDLDHQERSDVLGHLPEDVNAAPASSLVLEAAIDFIQLGLAVEDSGVEFASLITSETEVRIGNELRCQIANSRSSDGGDHVALSHRKSCQLHWRRRPAPAGASLDDGADARKRPSFSGGKGCALAIERRRRGSTGFVKAGNALPQHALTADGVRRFSPRAQSEVCPSRCV